MKHSFRLSRAAAAGAAAALLLIISGASSAARAQTLSPTPDRFIIQVTTTTIPDPGPAATPSPTPTPTTTPSPTPTPGRVVRSSYASDMSADGRFVVIESEGDIATDRTPERNNADGNQEIFLFDYAQRRIYQITNTKNALINTSLSALEPSNIDVRIVNLQPQISRDGRFIVFISNAYLNSDPTLTPAGFSAQGRSAELKTDGNTEIFLYAVPQPPAADLASGADLEPFNLAGGAMTRVTTTAATRAAAAGGTNIQPFFARDNDAPSISDDGNIIAFVSYARTGIPGSSNSDGNPEIFTYNRTAGTFFQITTTTDKASPGNPLPTLVFNLNPSLSGSGTAMAFVSNADINSSETAADQGNGEVYVATLASTGGLASLRQVTVTPPERREGFIGIAVNVFSPGRRISRSGNFVAFESTANFNTNGSLNGSLANSYGIYVYDFAANSFAQVGNRAPDNDDPDLGLRFPTFTGDNTRVVWASNLNLKADGTVAARGSADGLNPSRRGQIFSAPVASLPTVSRLTNNPAPLSALSTPLIQVAPGNTARRIAFSTTQTELGGGNPDQFPEVFYMLVPAATSETPAPSPTPAASPAPVTFSTGATDRPVVAPSPSPTPPAVTGLAPGMLGIMRSTLALAPSPLQVGIGNADETRRRPGLPAELNGVSVSVGDIGAAAGLYSVAPGQINFVVPPGLTPSATPQPVVINNNGAVIRTSLVLNSAQPDIFTSTNGAGGRALVLNVTNPLTQTTEPFPAPSRLLIMLTGVRLNTLTTANVTVRIGTTDLTGAAIVSIGPSQTAGFDQIVVDVPASLAGAGDVPVIVTISVGGATFTSRPAESAPRITIQ
ncbi:MAG TPA: hypothetical protein VGX48_17140 [Pyrinomonadaceae bacterium]|nr:hypothetical protein [Pyrinomonadaceae bacterium]